jgi:hypothetical protein
MKLFLAVGAKLGVWLNTSARGRMLLGASDSQQMPDATLIRAMMQVFGLCRGSLFVVACNSSMLSPTTT